MPGCSHHLPMQRAIFLPSGGREVVTSCSGPAHYAPPAFTREGAFLWLGPLAICSELDSRTACLCTFCRVSKIPTLSGLVYGEGGLWRRRGVWAIPGTSGSEALPSYLAIATEAGEMGSGAQARPLATLRVTVACVAASRRGRRRKRLGLPDSARGRVSYPQFRVLDFISPCYKWGN